MRYGIDALAVARAHGLPTQELAAVLLALVAAEADERGPGRGIWRIAAEALAGRD
ncbi:hypothetical protein AB0C51_07915 [Streptomyces pathocidini]|uniref:hypothetical protein n=1 Tax=Streptomyces pathocidini TaxID=1650571 RepID=UPI0033D8D4AE